ncbi:MAG: cobalamin-dependent protein [Candidatus Adiutrix sp.]|jgi:methanogenic corrinoid protein MtbC1|nr:cobalamin-dependent protein [Candidatus Adiutrix sp.]
MNDQASLRHLWEVLVKLDEVAVADLTLELLDREVEPVEILTTCEQALTSIGEKYEDGEYFISGLIMAGEMMSRITELLTPHLVIPEADILRGRILIGTIEGDIHDLGKNIAGALLSAHGFQVLDLGVDVSATDFVKEALIFKPEIIGLSALLGSCFPALSKTITRLKEMRGMTKIPAIFISGAQITDEHRKLYGADFQAASAFDTVRLCEKIIRRGLGD